MTKRWTVMLTAVVLAIAACGGGSSSPSPGATTSATGTPTASATTGASASSSAGASGSPVASGTTGASGSPSAGCSSDVTADLKMGGWSAAGSTEENILQGVLDKFQTICPNIKVTFTPLADSYDSSMLVQLGTDNAPDLVYVNQSVSQDWINQNVLTALEDLPAAAGNDTSHFYPGFLKPFQKDGKTYAYPKDSSMLGMETNDDMLAAANVQIPTTTDELVAAATAIKNANIEGLEVPMCMSHEWQRAGAFVYSFGGAMINDDGSLAIGSAESKAGLDWYLQQIHDGLGMTVPDLGVGYCGDALKAKQVAIAFEGNWIGSDMATNAPDVKYTVSAIPMATEAATLAYTAGYAIPSRSQNKDAAWVLLQWLTGKEGMQAWVDGGLVLPSRDDVTVNDPLLAKFAAFAPSAHQGEGYFPQFSTVSDAFKNAMLTAAQNPSGTSDEVITATKAAYDQLMGGASASPSTSP
jgi:multiple sugar transport system substrate-binding protein